MPPACEYTVFNAKTGAVIGKTAERHASEQFVAFLIGLIVTEPRGQEIHVIADNFAAYKTRRVTEFL